MSPTRAAVPFSDPRTLTITADCGGSNGNRTRLWKTELQHLTDDTGLQITVCHFPPGTSKWNKIEHRLFSTGLRVYAELDERSYPDKIKIPDAELAVVQIDRHTFHPEWNYTIKPHT